jgi:probable blue pigment (indigoidine) exporter
VANGVAAVLANAQPLLIVLAWLLYQERPRGRTLLALLVGFVCLGIAASPGGVGGGALLSLGAAAAITAGTLLARRLNGVDVVALAGWPFLIGGVLLAGWASAVEGAPHLRWTPQFIAALAFLSLIGTAATYLIWFSELQHSPLVTLSAWTLLTPVFGVAFGGCC